MSELVNEFQFRNKYQYKRNVIRIDRATYLLKRDRDKKTVWRTRSLNSNDHSVHVQITGHHHTTFLNNQIYQVEDKYQYQERKKMRSKVVDKEELARTLATVPPGHEFPFGGRGRRGARCVTTTITHRVVVGNFAVQLVAKALKMPTITHRQFTRRHQKNGIRW